MSQLSADGCGWSLSSATSLARDHKQVNSIFVKSGCMIQPSRVQALKATCSVNVSCDYLSSKQETQTCFLRPYAHMGFRGESHPASRGFSFMLQVSLRPCRPVFLSLYLSLLSCPCPAPQARLPTVLRQPDGQRYFMHQARLVPLAVVFLKSPHTKTYEFCR